MEVKQLKAVNCNPEIENLLLTLNFNDLGGVGGEELFLRTRHSFLKKNLEQASITEALLQHYIFSGRNSHERNPLPSPFMVVSSSGVPMQPSARLWCKTGLITSL